MRKPDARGLAPTAADARLFDWARRSAAPRPQGARAVALAAGQPPEV